MSAIALLAVAALQGIPDDPRLETFRSLCVPDRRDMALTSARLDAAGWIRVEETDHPELAATTAIARVEMNDPEYPMEMQQEIWKAPDGPAGQYILINRVSAVIGEDEDTDGDGVLQSWEKADNMVLLGCGLWDFEATAGVHPGLLSAWTTQLAAETIDLPGQITGGTWNVYHFMPGTADVKTGFIPDGSPWVARTGFSGAMITMTSAPADDQSAEDGETGEETAGEGAADAPTAD